MYNGWQQPMIVVSSGNSHASVIMADQRYIAIDEPELHCHQSRTMGNPHEHLPSTQCRM
jgi:hypothetical protein